ncbi:MAG TPA: glycosyltransferase family 4 protein [Verrucomicrobiae bacterium]
MAHIIGMADGGGGRTVGLNAIAPCAEHFETYAILGRKGDLPELLRQRGVQVFTTGLDHAMRSLFSLPSLVSILRRIKPDVVVNYGQPGGMVGALACRLAGIKNVLYVTCFPSFYTDWDLFRVIRNHIVERISCRWATMVGCPSEAARYQYLLRQLVPSERAVYFPLGVDVKHINPTADKAAIRRELGLPEGVPLVVNVGRLVDQKRVDWLVRAWALVEARDEKAVLVIVGDGAERAALEKLAAELKLKRCRFLGVQPNGSAFFSAADLAVVTTLYEIPGLTVLEAMAAACPVVVTAADGVAESVQASNGGGVLVPLADPEALAKGILTLLQDEQMRSVMGKQGRAYVGKSCALTDAQLCQRELIQKVTGNSAEGLGRN